ncbi:hypothetical protein K4L44_09855 [Halosquirtibacter laminarini]|uniref:Uncharacterized protein n=1 Tax=Halosquirtibacter laminarini TaxID=3374600 RepID=A0AC61NBP2_9BACT|nr:hypothetical protein K4L44_09855 [Prolixibacteraceae bacterium]
MEGENAKALTQKTIDALIPFEDLIDTITSDNDREFYEHKQIADKLNNGYSDTGLFHKN